MARVTLFDQTSISPYSRFFWLENQVTVVGHGLQPDDYITFEAVETNAAPMAKNCGCDFVPAGAISLNSILELTCAACNGVVSPVVLTAANPVVVLDHPQGFYLRAVYHGTGLSTGEVIVRATDTETRDLTDALRGCPERCPDYVGTLCITPGTRAFGVNDPRDPEATVPIMREGNTVGYIYPTPRSHAPVPVTEDPCQPCDGNTVGAIIGYAMPWDGPETECLCLCYECQDVSWEQVGDAFCRNDTLWVDEISNCGRTRERNTGTPCGEEPCVPNWVNSGPVQCINGVGQQEQVDGCGGWRVISTGACGCQPEWVYIGISECVDGVLHRWAQEQCSGTLVLFPSVPQITCGDCVPEWEDVGSPVCEDGTLIQTRSDGCGNTETYDTGVPCADCEPDWKPTEEFNCSSTTYMRKWIDGCGVHEWREEAPVMWTDNGEQICNGTTNTWHQPEINQCGDTRLRDTGVPCEEPCVPGDWEDVPGATRCVGTQPQQQQTNGCEYRWVNAPVEWTPTGEEQCVDGFIQVRETNQCGDSRWRVTETSCGELVVTAPGCMVLVVHNWSMPCNPNDPETAGPLGTGCSVSVSGGSGNYSYSWTHTTILDSLGVSVSDSGAGFSVVEMGSAPRRECPFQGSAQGTSTVTVTDNVTGQTGSLSIHWVLEYTG